MNEETKRKLSEVDFDMLIQPPRKWSKVEETKLTEAVKQFAFEKLVTPFLNKYK